MVVNFLKDSIFQDGTLIMYKKWIQCLRIVNLMKILNLQIGLTILFDEQIIKNNSIHISLIEQLKFII